jgi:hypothetical protein
MKLTGKAKQDFEKWFVVNAENYEGLSFSQITIVKDYQLDLFNQLTDSMQWGVLVDWGDSVGITISVRRKTSINKFSILIVDETESGSHTTYNVIANDDCDSTYRDSRPEARTAAIEKLDEIYNEKTTR